MLIFYRSFFNGSICDISQSKQNSFILSFFWDNLPHWGSFIDNISLVHNRSSWLFSSLILSFVLFTFGLLGMLNLFIETLVVLRNQLISLFFKLRYAFIFCIGHLGLLNSARIPLLWVQQFSEDWEGLFCVLVCIIFSISDHRWLLLIFSYIRFEAFAFYPWMYDDNIELHACGITHFFQNIGCDDRKICSDRILVMVSDFHGQKKHKCRYEKQDRNTVFVIFIILFIFEAVAIILAYLVLYQDMFASETGVSDSLISVME